MTGTITHGKAAGQANTSILVINRLIKANGNINFQARAISWSILTRGSVVRVHTMTKNITKTLMTNQRNGGNSGPLQPLKKRVVMMAEKTTVRKFNIKRVSLQHELENEKKIRFLVDNRYQVVIGLNKNTKNETWRILDIENKEKKVELFNQI